MANVVRMNKYVFTVILLCLMAGGCLFASLWSRGGQDVAEVKLLFDPDDLKQQVSPCDDYGEKPLPLPLPPDTEEPYEPSLENEYY